MKISVITPSLNSGRYLDRAIRSVLDQGDEEWEHIVVDGGSTDQSVSILGEYPHLKWISEPDQGQSDAMNKGFELSSGDIIVYLNADDYFHPGVFDHVRDRMARTQTDILVGKVEIHWLEKVMYRGPTSRNVDIIKYWRHFIRPKSTLVDGLVD